MRTRYEMTACVLLRRDDRWLLTVRSPDVAYAPGRIGLVGGHVEPVAGPGVLEATARREASEETGLDLAGVPLHYLSSEAYWSGEELALTVTFVGELPAGAEPRLTAPPTELSAVGWWSAAEAAAADNCAPWVPALLRSAGALLDRLSR